MELYKENCNRKRLTTGFQRRSNAVILRLLVVSPPSGFIHKRGRKARCPRRILPSAKLGVHVQIFLWNWMGAQNHFYAIFFLEEIFESVDVRAGRISHQQTSRQVDHLRAIFDHFVAGIFNISAWTSGTGGVADQFNVGVSINAEGAFAVSHRSQAFSACASAISVSDNDPNFCLFFHYAFSTIHSKPNAELHLVFPLQHNRQR